MKLRKLILLPLLATLLVGCGTKEQKIDRSDTDALLPTPVTDAFKFAQKDSLEGKTFAHYDEASKGPTTSDHMGFVSLRSCTDGDTANFVQEGYVNDTGDYISIKTRFLGVNTPESTAKVEPWGKKASMFTKKLLTAAQESADKATAADKSHKKHYNIALINNPAGGNFEEKDSSGNRWLAFIWYRLDETKDWRLLNLELVEQAYSRNQLFTDDPICNYRAEFVKCEERNSKGGYRLYGEVDKDFDYTEKIYEYSLYYIINHYDEIGITEEGSSGLQLLVTALVVSSQGDNMFLRDIFHDNDQKEGDNTLAGLYAYAGFNSGIGSMIKRASSMQGLNENGCGVVVRFYCRATVYGGNVQLSDIKNSTVGTRAFTIVKESNFSKYKSQFNWSKEYGEKGESLAWTDVNKDYSAVTMDTSNFTTAADMGAYQYQFVETNVVIRSVQPGEIDDEGSYSTTGDAYWYKGHTTESLSYTVYASVIGKDDKAIYTNLRIDASIYPFIEPASFGTDDKFDLTSENSPVGKTFHVTGFVLQYYEKYQITLPNNFSDMNYFYRLDV